MKSRPFAIVIVIFFNLCLCFTGCSQKDDSVETTFTGQEGAAPSADQIPAPKMRIIVSPNGQYAQLVAKAIRVRLADAPEVLMVQLSDVTNGSDIIINNSESSLMISWGSPASVINVELKELDAWNLAGKVLTSLGAIDSTTMDQSNLGQYWTEIMGSHSGNGANKTIAALKRLLKRDEFFTPAWISMSDLYEKQYHHDHRVIWLTLMEESAKRVKALGNIDGTVVLGRVAFLRGDWKNANARYNEAINAAPFHPGAWTGRGELLLQAGLFRLSATAFEQALNTQPTSSIQRTLLGWAWLGLNKNNKALQEFNQVRNTSPYLYSGKALALCRLERCREALEQFPENNNEPLLRSIKVHTLINLNRHDEALAILDTELAAAAEEQAELAVGVAAGYAHLGRPGEAVRMMKRADAAGYSQYPWIMNDPYMAKLRKDSRVLESLKNIETRWKDRVAGLQ